MLGGRLTLIYKYVYSTLNRNLQALTSIFHSLYVIVSIEYFSIIHVISHSSLEPSWWKNIAVILSHYTNRQKPSLSCILDQNLFEERKN